MQKKYFTPLEEQVLLALLATPTALWIAFIGFGVSWLLGIV
jgi:hypothetical protein